MQQERLELEKTLHSNYFEDKVDVNYLVVCYYKNEKKKVKHVDIVFIDPVSMRLAKSVEVLEFKKQFDKNDKELIITTKYYLSGYQKSLRDLFYEFGITMAIILLIILTFKIFNLI